MIKNSETIIFDSQADEINIKNFIYYLWSNKYFIFFVTFAVSFTFAVCSLLIDDKYTATASLYPNNNNEKLSSTLNQYTSVANFAGISLPSESTSPHQEAILRLESFDFFKNFFLTKIKLENLFAVEKWHDEENLISYNKKIFLKETSEWVREVDFPKKQIPSAQEAYEKFKKIYKLDHDEKNNSVELEITHKSPYIAKAWLDIIIMSINESMREIDQENAFHAIDFLKNESNKNQISEINDAISVLLKSQMETLMMTSIGDSYIFKNIESPVISEEKSSPNRLLISFIGIIVGFMISLMYLLYKNYISTSYKPEIQD